MNGDASIDIDRADDAEVLLSGYPGAAVLVDGDGQVLRANPKGAGLEALIAHEAMPEVQDLVSKARSMGSVSVGTITLQSSKGEIVLETTVVPLKADRLLVMTRDLTMDRNLRSALVESRQRYKDLVEVSSDFCWETSPDGDFVFVSPDGALDYSADDLIDHPAADFIVNADDYSPLPFFSKRPLEDVEMWFRRKDGETACMMLSCVPLFTEADGERQWSGSRGVCRDVSMDRDNEAALARARHREQLLNYIVSMIRDELEPENMLSAAATATTRALEVAGCRIFRQTETGKFGVAAEYGNAQGIEGLENQLETLTPTGEVSAFRLGNWEVLAVATHYRHVINGAICIWKSAAVGAWEADYQILIGDVANQLGIANEQISNHERIIALSRTDSMTGLLNRRAFFEEELPRRVSRLKRSRQTAALFYVDMDNFKLVNDVHGHQKGDEAIMHLRDMLMDFSRPGDVIARLGGDEFAMWLDGIAPDVTENRAKALVEASATMKQFSGSDEHPLGISVGVAVYDPDSGETFDEMLARADKAMYAVKKAHKGGYKLAMAPESGGGD